MGHSVTSREGIPLEIERKYLIEFPDLLWLESFPECRKHTITQIYIITEAGERLRIRQIMEDGSYTYFKTLKRDITNVTRIEIEESISENDYKQLLAFADPKRRAIQKTRYCLPFRNHCFEIDIYPFWNDRAIMETELDSEDEEICFPPEVKIIREVTEEQEYRNSSLALRS